MASIVEDLKVWVSIAQWVLLQIQKLPPILTNLAIAFATLLHVAIEAFRSVIRPVFEFLFGWLPFHIPQMWQDGLVVVAFIYFGTGRATTLLRGAKTKAFRNAVRDIATKHGVLIETHGRLLEIAMESKRARTDTSSPEEGSADEARAKAFSLYGEAFEKFEADYKNLLKDGFSASDLYLAEIKTRILIWYAGGIVLLLAAYDTYIFGKSD